MSLPTTMKAWVHTTRGDPVEVLHLVDKPIPKITDDQVLVKVKCVALNPAAGKVMKYFPFIISKSATPEMDLSGVVVGIGSSVTGFKEGDEVFGMIPAESNIRSGVGALAQYAPVSERYLLKKNPKTSWQDAAALPLTSLTAIHCWQQAKLKEGQTVFVNGGSGGLGYVTVQIAKAMGAKRVVSSCSDRNVDFVKSMGADEVIPYNTEDVPKKLAEKYGNNKFDSIVDAFGNKDIFQKSESYLKEDGRFVNAGADFNGFSGFFKFGLTVLSNTYLPSFLGGVKRQYETMLLDPTRERFEKLGELIDSGKLKAVIDSTHSFENVIPAYEKLATNRARGKIIINVDV